ncbi:sirohydrochlorin ferrochelatase, chloroplastic isoform X2 [Aristolochia californica]|uniref:sirohydrochlorin ferrochelatase, chloroplastic isoform X2 n=1 Tax=Aristolochia californica TaxID=171875 RepID=UPI0035DAAD37
MMNSASVAGRITVNSGNKILIRGNERYPVCPEFIKLPRNFAKSRNISPISCLSIRNEENGRNKNVVGERDGLIIVDHGSRRQESNLMLNEFVAMFKGKTGYSIVEPAHMELAEPSIGDAFSSCVQKGATRIIVSPFFLFPGKHWHQDIPTLAAEAAKSHPGISYLVTAPLGLHKLLVDIVNDRIKQCLTRAAGEGGECEVCAGTGKCRFH